MNTHDRLDFVQTETKCPAPSSYSNGSDHFKALGVVFQWVALRLSLVSDWYHPAVLTVTLVKVLLLNAKSQRIPTKKGFLLFLLFFNTGSLCVALAVLELPL